MEYRQTNVMCCLFAMNDVKINGEFTVIKCRDMSCWHDKNEMFPTGVGSQSDDTKRPIRKIYLVLKTDTRESLSCKNFIVNLDKSYNFA